IAVAREDIDDAKSQRSHGRVRSSRNRRFLEQPAHLVNGQCVACRGVTASFRMKNFSQRAQREDAKDAKIGISKKNSSLRSLRLRESVFFSLRADLSQTLLDERSGALVVDLGEACRVLG